jgi:FkbM family methyltransferase
VECGELFFERVSWFEAALAARGRYTMITLGALYGAQAIGAYRALQRLNPMPAKLVAVEPDPENFNWLIRTFHDNDINPAEHWLFNCAVADSNKPVLFPVGSPGTGANNCMATTHEQARREYARQILASKDLEERVFRLIIDGDTGVDIDLAPNDPRGSFPGRIQFISAVSLADVLAPFECIDLLEADIQSAEIVVFPPAMGLIKRKAKHVYIGTHGNDVHDALLQELAASKFEIIFSYKPNATFETPHGSFSTHDGILFARNPDL